MKEKILQALEERLKHHENWLFCMVDSKHYHSVSQWGGRVQELKEIIEIIQEMEETG